MKAYFNKCFTVSRLLCFCIMISKGWAKFVTPAIAL